VCQGMKLGFTQTFMAKITNEITGLEIVFWKTAVFGAVNFANELFLFNVYNDSMMVITRK
jgi:hypothetical protein